MSALPESGSGPVPDRGARPTLRRRVGLFASRPRVEPLREDHAMPVPSEVHRALRALLGGGEEPRYIVPAVCGPQVYFMVTDDAVVLVQGRWLREGQPQRVLRRFRRSVRLGPVESFGGVPSFKFDGFWFEIEDEYIAVVNAIDADRDPAAALPPDPLPGL